MRPPLPYLLVFKKTEDPLLLSHLSLALSFISHKHINWAICIALERTRTLVFFHNFYKIPFDIGAYFLVNTTRPVATPVKFQHRTFGLIISSLLRSYALIIGKGKISSAPLIVLICINQRVSSLNKWCFLSLLASVYPWAPLCIFVSWAKHSEWVSEAASLKPGEKITFCGQRMN